MIYHFPALRPRQTFPLFHWLYFSPFCFPKSFLKNNEWYILRSFSLTTNGMQLNLDAIYSAWCGYTMEFIYFYFWFCFTLAVLFLFSRWAMDLMHSIFDNAECFPLEKKYVGHVCIVWELLRAFGICIFKYTSFKEVRMFSDSLRVLIVQINTTDRYLKGRKKTEKQ